ncbi:unnamed protein product [Linum tenue]|uniref:ACT domain-containing protein n=1 Tax=Linum tenue TaxID=586396 RepID=A0AAV0HCY6_9ROSI|nr:unnamed protein product [Linum tenue]
MGDTESCSSRAVDFVPAVSRNQRQKVAVYNEVLRRLTNSNDEESGLPGFEDELWNHFLRLPTRGRRTCLCTRDYCRWLMIRLLGRQLKSGWYSFADSFASLYYPSLHPPPAFGSLPDLELAYEAQDKDTGKTLFFLCYRLMHEITISTNDKPKLLSQLTSLLSELDLNIQEAHAFSTTDGYSLDVFVVDNWSSEETYKLRVVLENEIPKIEVSTSA